MHPSKVVVSSSAPKAEAPKTAGLVAFQHPGTGHRMILQEHERTAFHRISEALTADLKPAGESERQMVYKIVAAHQRLNRISAVESNLLNFSMNSNSPHRFDDARIEGMAAQSRACIAESAAFDTLSRMEYRLSRQLLLYTKELERIQNLRRSRKSNLQVTHAKSVNPKLASFGKKPIPARAAV